MDYLTYANFCGVISWFLLPALATFNVLVFGKLNVRSEEYRTWMGAK